MQLTYTVKTNYKIAVCFAAYLFTRKLKLNFENPVYVLQKKYNLKKMHFTALLMWYNHIFTARKIKKKQCTKLDTQ